MNDDRVALKPDGSKECQKRFERMERVFNAEWHTARINVLIDQHNEMVTEIETLRAERDALSATMPCSECVHWKSENDERSCELGIDRNEYFYVICPGMRIEATQITRLEIADHVLNPNCSDVVFRLPGLSREDAVKKLREIGIIEVSSNPDGKYPFLADRDNPMVPNMDSEYGCAMLDIDEWDKGEIVIHGGINLEFSTFPTMKKIRDAFPGKKWDEMIGGSMTKDFEEWIENGMKMTPRLVKFAKGDRKTPGRETKKFRADVIDPAFAALNPNCSEVVFELSGMSSEEAMEKLKAAGIDASRFHLHDDELIDMVEIRIDTSWPLAESDAKSMMAIEKMFGGEWMKASGNLVGYDILKEKMAAGVTLNPNCSEIVLELPGMAKEAALSKLREIGIIEVEIPENVMYNRDSDKVLRVLVDRDNPNCPDFTFHDALGFHETSGRPETWRSRAAVRDTLFQMAYARKLPGNGPVGDEAAEITPENGRVLVDLAAAFKKPRLDYGDVRAIIDAWPGFTGDGKWHLKSVFGSRMLFKCSVGDPVASALQISRMLGIMGNGMINGKSMDDIALAIHEKYPDYDTAACYFTTGSDTRSLFPTMKKVAVLFNRDWHGHDGGGTGSYENWEDEMESTRISVEMRGRGKTDEQVAGYLKEKYPWCEKVIDAVERGEPMSTAPVDHQDDAGRQKRATIRGFPDG